MQGNLLDPSMYNINPTHVYTDKITMDHPTYNSTTQWIKTNIASDIPETLFNQVVCHNPDGIMSFSEMQIWVNNENIASQCTLDPADVKNTGLTYTQADLLPWLTDGFLSTPAGIIEMLYLSKCTFILPRTYSIYELQAVVIYSRTYSSMLNTRQFLALNGQEVLELYNGSEYRSGYTHFGTTGGTSSISALNANIDIFERYNKSLKLSNVKLSVNESNELMINDKIAYQYTGDFDEDHSLINGIDSNWATFTSDYGSTTNDFSVAFDWNNPEPEPEPYDSPEPEPEPEPEPFTSHVYSNVNPQWDKTLCPSNSNAYRIPFSFNENSLYKTKTNITYLEDDSTTAIFYSVYDNVYLWSPTFKTVTFNSAAYYDATWIVMKGRHTFSEYSRGTEGTTISSVFGTSDRSTNTQTGSSDGIVSQANIRSYSNGYAVTFSILPNTIYSVFLLFNHHAANGYMDARINGTNVENRSIISNSIFYNFNGSTVNNSVVVSQKITKNNLIHHFDFRRYGLTDKGYSNNSSQGFFSIANEISIDGDRGVYFYESHEQGGTVDHLFNHVEFTNVNFPSTGYTLFFNFKFQTTNSDRDRVHSIGLGEKFVYGINSYTTIRRIHIYSDDGYYRWEWANNANTSYTLFNNRTLPTSLEVNTFLVVDPDSNTVKFYEGDTLIETKNI